MNKIGNGNIGGGEETTSMPQFGVTFMEIGNYGGIIMSSVADF